MFVDSSVRIFTIASGPRCGTPAGEVGGWGGEAASSFRALFEMAERGLLKTKVEKSYPLSDAKAAVAHAAQGKRSGKIVFEFGD